MKTMIDNVAIQAIEWCLVANIKDVFSPSHVLQMDVKLVSRIAEESRHDQSLRESTNSKLAALQSGLATCKNHAARKAPGKSSSILPT
ncbi:MAG: hypothetical protein Q9190_005505, partial [Brigantiaea leucoxantha]